MSPDLRRLDFERGPASMLINDRVRPAYEWCEMFGHEPNADESFCLRCGGAAVPVKEETNRP